MSLSDLVFILVFLATIITVVVISVKILRGQKQAAMLTARNLGVGLAVYFLIVAAVAFSAPQHVLRMGEDRCFDEMCFAATDVTLVPALGQGTDQVKAHGNFYVVTIRMSSHARGKAQREAGVWASLIDTHGHSYDVSPQGQHVYEMIHGPVLSLTSRLQPGETTSTVQVFDVAPTASGVSLHFGHSGPGLFIIGDDESPLHKPTITPLE